MVGLYFCRELGIVGRLTTLIFMYDFVGMLKGIGEGVANGFGWARDRMRLFNSDKMQTTQEAKKTEAQIAENREVIDKAASGDEKALEELRKRSS